MKTKAKPCLYYLPLSEAEVSGHPRGAPVSLCRGSGRVHHAASSRPKGMHGMIRSCPLSCCRSALQVQRREELRVQRLGAGGGAPPPRAGAGGSGGRGR